MLVEAGETNIHPEKGRPDMFDAFEISLQTVSSLRAPVRTLQARNADLARQVKRAGSSITLNIAEGRRRTGKDRLHLWRIAAGSADEVRAALRTAVAWDDLPPSLAEEPLALLDRVIAMLWKMTH